MEFSEYHMKVSPHIVLIAVQVTDENFDAVCIMLHNQKSFITEGRIWFNLELYDGQTDQQIAEIGDYIVSDMAGKFIAVDKEMFEDYYEKQ